MKKALFIYLILGFTASSSKAQNLVPNYSFEIYDTCPCGLCGQIYRAIPWVDPTKGSSDYFNPCNPGDGVPVNGAGSQTAQDGNAYAGFIAWVEPPSNNIREYIQVELINSLESNTCYRVSFYVSIADNDKYGVNTLSAYFSNNAISCLSCFLSYTPQFIYYDPAVIGNDSTWYKVEGTFIAAGGERYITIGNFSTDSNTKTTIVNPGMVGFAYYYIDNVSVVPCDSMGSSLTLPLPNIFTPNDDGTNDIFKILSTNLKTFNCKIYNRWGVLVKEIENEDESWDGRTISGSNCTDGVYYYILSAEGEDGKEYNEKGFIQLIR